MSELFLGSAGLLSMYMYARAGGGSGTSEAPIHNVYRGFEPPTGFLEALVYCKEVLRCVCVCMRGAAAGTRCSRPLTPARARWASGLSGICAPACGALSCMPGVHARLHSLLQGGEGLCFQARAPMHAHGAPAHPCSNSLFPLMLAHIPPGMCMHPTAPSNPQPETSCSPTHAPAGTS